MIPTLKLSVSSRTGSVFVRILPEFLLQKQDSRSSSKRADPTLGVTREGIANWMLPQQLASTSGSLPWETMLITKFTTRTHTAHSVELEVRGHF